MPHVAIIGGGQMAEALLAGILNAGTLRAEELFATDVSAERREHLHRRFRIRVSSHNVDAVRWADTVVLAVKPQVIGQVLQRLGSSLDGRLVISIAAGVPIATLAAHVPATVRIVRVMPNAPALIGAGVSALSWGDDVTEADSRFVQRLMEAVGLVVVVPETQMDAVTALSGSGPAYVFIACDALADGAIKMGLSRDQAVSFAAWSMLGAARMVLETGEQVAALRERVASAASPAAYGVHRLEEGGARTALVQAVEQAALRAREFGKGS